jgi:hypothetical protein
MVIDTNTLSQEDRATIASTALWARQTIAFAMSIRNSAITGSFDDPEVCRLGAQEAEHLTEEIWQKVAEQSSTVPKAVFAYAEKVFDWCHKHVHR